MRKQPIQGYFILFNAVLCCLVVFGGGRLLERGLLLFSLFLPMDLFCSGCKNPCCGFLGKQFGKVFRWVWGFII